MSDWHEVHISLTARSRRLRRLRAALPDLRPNRQCDPHNIPAGSVCYEYPTGREKEFERAASSAAIAFQWGGGAAATFKVYRIEPDNSMVLVGSVTTTETIKRFVRIGAFFFGVASDGSSQNLTVIDANKPNAPEQVTVFNTGTVAGGVSAQGHLVFVFGPNIKIIDVSVPGVPRVVGTL